MQTWMEKHVRASASDRKQNVLGWRERSVTRSDSACRLDCMACNESAQKRATSCSRALVEGPDAFLSPTYGSTVIEGVR
jgi:hypothetical protein